MNITVNGLKNNAEQISKLLLGGKVGIVPTDTLYGISAITSNQKSVENIYDIKQRDKDKPFIILISELNDLNKFDIKTDDKTGTFLKTLWPNKVSVILPCPNEKYSYLHRGTKQLAFRIPNFPDLLELLKISGPIVSTSVNSSGEEPAVCIEEISQKFGNKIDFYIDQGILQSPPTTVIKIEAGQISIVRQGEFIIDPGMLK